MRHARSRSGAVEYSASAIASIFIVYVSIFSKRASDNHENDISSKRDDVYNEIKTRLTQLELHKDLPEDAAGAIEAVV